MKMVTVIPLKKGAFSEDLTYFSAQDVPMGAVVSVTLRGKKILALTTSVEDVTEVKSGIKSMPFNLKKITSVKERSIFRPEFLESALESGNYFAVRKSDAVAALIPELIKEEYDKISAFALPENANRKNSAKNIRGEKLLLQMPENDRLSLYRTLIRSSFAEKKSVFIILPTVRDAEEFYNQLSKGLENFAFCFHGSLPRKKILENIQKVMELDHPVLIFATAPYLAIPRQDIQTIILEHESSSAYRMIARPWLDMRIFAEIFAQNTGARLILSDSLLSLDTLGREKRDGFSPMHPLSWRTSFRGELAVVGQEEKFEVLMDRTMRAIKDALMRKERVFIFSLRKGLATMTVCRDCGEPVMCANCSAPLVLYLSRDGKKRMFACNRCRSEADPETACKNCGSWNLAPLGIGTDTVAEALEKSLAKDWRIKIFKLDKESAKSGKEAERIARQFEETPGSVLIGTEMSFFYLKEKVPLSVVASLDSLWSLPSFRAGEKVLHLVLEIISRTEKEIVIQTKNSANAALRAFENENLSAFVREELADRERMGYPPYRRFIKISSSGEKDEAKQAREFLAETFREYKPEIFSGFIVKKKGAYTANALLRIDADRWSLPEITQGGKLDARLEQKLRDLPAEFRISIDPEDML